MRLINKLYTLLITVTLLVAVSCTETETQALFTDNLVGFSSTAVNADEDGSAVEVQVEIIGQAQSSDVTISYDITESGITEGVDYSIVGSSSLIIPAGEYTGSITIQPIDNEDIAEGAQSITLTITGVDSEGVSIGGEGFLGRSTQFNILDNDFWCPRNTLGKVVTEELDVGFSTNAVSISFAASPDEDCLSFRITGGAGSLFGGFANISYVVTLVEDSFESNTGTVEPVETFNLNNGDGSGSYTNLLRITGGSYDLAAGILEVNYEYYGTDNVFQYDGIFRYTDGS